ncbi:hypothetical protein [Ferrimicrobium acidiphilum]|jgi:hypothetical protein|nr:hypothetical protein [Ferrimicrobium acidiphilum]
MTKDVFRAEEVTECLRIASLKRLPEALGISCVKRLVGIAV